MKRILIVDSDMAVRSQIGRCARLEGYEVAEASDGYTAISLCRQSTFDLVILAILLPELDGFSVCQTIRSFSHVPILILSGCSSETDRIRGLELGADDYVAKPFDPAELVARVKAHLSRYKRLTGGRGEDDGAILVGDVRILPQSWRVFKGDREVKMPNREFALLKYLAENPNIVFSKEQLFEAIWGYDYLGDSATVTVHVGRIRDKIEDDPANPKLIETV